MKIYMATWLQEAAQKEALDIMKNKSRLMSYHFIISGKEKLLEYMEGRNENRNTKHK